MLSRRGFLAVGAAGAGAAVLAGAGLVELQVLPGRARVHRALGLTGTDGAVPDVAPGPVESGRFASAARRTSVGWSIVRPPGSPAGARLPVAVLLHGRGGDHGFAVGELGVDRYLAAAVAAGVPPFALATVDGGPDSYWHRRADGADPQRMVLGELLPLLTARGLRTDRIGLLGWSMGGYGALLLATVAGPGRIAAAVACSPALWRDPADAAAGAFDDDADFRAHDMFAAAGRLAGVPLRVDCGRDDPFAAATEDLRERVRPVPAGGLQAGEHTPGYWRRMLPDQLAFLGPRLTP